MHNEKRGSTKLKFKVHIWINKKLPQLKNIVKNRN